MLKNGRILHFDILSFVESNFSQDKNYGYALHYVSFIHLKLTKHKNEMLWKDLLGAYKLFQIKLFKII